MKSSSHVMQVSRDVKSVKATAGLLAAPGAEKPGGRGSRQLAAAAFAAERRTAGDCSESATTGGRGEQVIRERGSRRRWPLPQPRRWGGGGRRQPAASSGGRPGKVVGVGS